MSTNACDRLRQIYIKQQFWENRLAQATEKNDYNLARRVLRERQSFYRQYKNEVRHLFAKWYDDQEFTDSIEFESDGRVVVTDDFELLDEKISKEYFPSLIKKVRGSFTYHGEKLDRLDSLEEVGGNLSIGESSISSLKGLVEVGHSINAEKAKKLCDLSSLERVGKGLFIAETSLESLPALVHVGDVIHAFNLAGLKHLPNLVFAGSLFLAGTSIASLPKLEKVESSCFLEDIESLVALPSLRTTSSLKLKGSSVVSLPELETVEDVFIPNKSLKYLPKLKNVGQLILHFSEVRSIPELKEVKFLMRLRWTKIRNFKKAFPQLKTIGRLSDLSFQSTSLFLIMQLVNLQRKGKISIAGRVESEVVNVLDKFKNVFKGYR
jgi:hypothetical protein